MVGFTSPKLQQWRGIDDLRLQQVIDIKKANDFLIVKNKWLNIDLIHIFFLIFHEIHCKCVVYELSTIG